MMTKLMIAASAALLLAACGASEPSASNTGADVKSQAEKWVIPDALPEKFEGAATAKYKLENTHAFLTASVSHGGLSSYKMDFTDFDATVNFDTKFVGVNSVSATINPAKVITHYPGNYKQGHANSGFETWDEHLSMSPKFFNAKEFPQITFSSNNVKRTGDYEAEISGPLTFLGVSKPVTLHVTYNGVTNKPWYGDLDVIGFDAKTTIKRSDFGMEHLLPNIGDEVEISFTGEFLQIQ